MTGDMLDYMVVVADWGTVVGLVHLLVDTQGMQELAAGCTEPSLAGKAAGRHQQVHLVAWVEDALGFELALCNQ